MTQNTGQPRIINDIGAIQSLEIPVGWVESTPRKVVGGRHLRQFHLFKRPDIRFCSYLRTLPLSHPTSAAFQQIMYADFHQVEQVELDTLDEILEGMSDSNFFQILDASTSYVNSRRVLTVKGRWLKMHEETVICIVDVKVGLFVQQIYFTAPQFVFQTYTKTANDMFLSIKWKHAN